MASSSRPASCPSNPNPNLTLTLPPRPRPASYPSPSNPNPNPNPNPPPSTPPSELPFALFVSGAFPSKLLHFACDVLVGVEVACDSM